MKRLTLVLMLILVAAPGLLADTQDTAVFRTRMVSDNEVPPIVAVGNSANGAITIRVTRNAAGNIDAATVIFDVDYTVTPGATFTGLHIHNAAPFVNGAVVIDSGISGTSPVTVATGSGRITRVVNYTSSDITPLRFITGLLATPENYYVNIHTTTNAGGFLRGQLMATRVVFRPIMSPLNEVPALTLDAEGAAAVEVQVTRDPQTAAITSGTVTFDVDYRFPSAVTITGLHLHNGPAGVNAPVVIDSGINGTTRAIGGVTRGNIFRIAEIDSSNTAGLAALTGLMNDPTQFYINLHTTVNPGGVIRGQLSKNAYVFFNLMTQAEEVPPTGVPGLSNSMTYVRVDRDSTGNITNGEVSFNLNYNFGSAQTFTGLHIHNGKFGQNGGVVIGTTISGSSPVVSSAGFGSINIEVPIATNVTALDALRGLLENPENYYVNIHTTQFGGGIIRAQLAREVYHFKTNMSTANEVPPITGVDTAATGWVTAKINRDAAGAITGGTVTFDVNYTSTGSNTFTGLHIHHPGAAGVNAGVVINTGIGGTSTVEGAAGGGNITRVVDVPSSNTAGVAALVDLISRPDNAYVNLHTTQFGGGVVRSQMFPVANTVAQVAAGSDWTTVITLSNASNVAVEGAVNLFLPTGAAFPEAASDPNMSFLVPPQSSLTFATYNKGNFYGGLARVFSNGSLAVETRYLHPSFSASAGGVTTTTARSVSIPVNVGSGPTPNTGIALIAGSAGTLTLSLRDSSGAAITGGSRTIDVSAGQQISLFVKEFLPAVTAPSFTGTLTITAGTGTISILALQFDGTISPVTITALP